MNAHQRAVAYVGQSGVLTPRQKRRLIHKLNKATRRGILDGVLPDGFVSADRAMIGRLSLSVAKRRKQNGHSGASDSL
jgi:hypothetical protein